MGVRVGFRVVEGGGEGGGVGGWGGEGCSGAARAQGNE